jgi:FkbM family methyltransferase
MRAIDERFRRRLANGQRSWLDRQGIRATTRVAHRLYASRRLSPSPASPNSLLSRVLRPGDVVIDGGANVGQMSRIASIAVGDAGEVHAFEPNPAVFRSLFNCMSGGGFDNVRCNDVALAAEPGAMTLFIAENGVSSTLSSTHLDANEIRQIGEVIVRCITLDDYRSELSRPVDLVKLDLEGYELTALQGAVQLIARDAPLFVCETFPSGPIKDMIAFMMSQGYACYSMGIPPELISSPEDYRPGRHLDVLFVHPQSRLRGRETAWLPDITERFRGAVEAPVAPAVHATR